MSDKLGRKRELLLDSIINSDDNSALKSHISLILDKYNLNGKSIKVILDEPDVIPCSIFSHDLGIAESIIKYLRENKGLSYREISKILNKSENCIRVSYFKVKKFKSLTEKQDSFGIPILIFKKSENTTFETIVVYLKESVRLSYHKIAVLLDRDERTIWATYNRRI